MTVSKQGLVFVDVANDALVGIACMRGSAGNTHCVLEQRCPDGQDDGQHTNSERYGMIQLDARYPPTKLARKGTWRLLKLNTEATAPILSCHATYCSPAAQRLRRPPPPHLALPLQSSPRAVAAFYLCPPSSPVSKRARRTSSRFRILADLPQPFHFYLCSARLGIKVHAHPKVQHPPSSASPVNAVHARINHTRLRLRAALARLLLRFEAPRRRAVSLSAWASVRCPLRLRVPCWQRRARCNSTTTILGGCLPRTGTPIPHYFFSFGVSCARRLPSPTMPRSSFSRNPLLRVSRPVSACSRCRSAKVKCDGKLPACTACEKAGRESECSAANDQFARGKERSYVAALELRIEKLERRLQFAKSRKASVANHEHDVPFANDMNRKDSLALIKAAIHRKAARNRENSDVNSLVSDFGYMSVNAITRDFEPDAFNVTFAGLVLTATMNNALPVSTEPDLPPNQVTNSIAQYFMTHIYTLFPCFSETTLWSVIGDLYHEDHRAIRDSDYWLLYMVLAIGYTAQSQQINDTSYECGVEYVVKALKYADQALAPGTGTQIQSLLLLTIYSLLDPAHFDSWHLLGFTARACIDLGFHQDPPTSSASDRTALNIRRRIFYSVYALDRAISMVHARTFSFTDDSINVAFPASLSQTRKQSLSSGSIATPQSTDAALLLFQLRRAQSFWYQELYQSDPTPLSDPTTFLWQMCLDMREWGESLPETLPPGIRRMFEQELRYSYVYCIAPSVRAPQITDYSRTLIFEYSLEYLNIMHEIARTGLNSAFYTYHDALKVYFMGNQLLAVLRDAEEMLLSGRPVPPPPQRPGCPPAPPIPRRTSLPASHSHDALERSLWCLERVHETLAKYSERWEDATMLKDSFQQISADTLRRLRELRALRSVPQQPQHSPHLQQQHHPQQQPQQQAQHQQYQQHQHVQHQQQQQQQQQQHAQHQQQQQHQQHAQHQQHQQMPPQQHGQYPNGVPINQLSQAQMGAVQHQQQQQQPWVGVNVSQMMHGGPHRPQ
ncbi:hypothetical protein PWT90_01129 [Aphanocladium album]|nr:hypothetical protein PWT90_01129 [Aphanocladium album]